MRDQEAHIRLVSARTEAPTDEALAQAAGQGQHWAQRAIYDRYAELVRKYLHRALGSEHEIEDLVQDVFLRVLRTLPTLRDPGALRNFVFAVASNALRMHLRRRRVRRLVRFAKKEDELDPISPLAGPETQLALQRMRRILERLPFDEREVFVLRYFVGFKLIELPEITGMSLSTAKRRLGSATRRVARLASKDTYLSNYLAERLAQGEKS